MKSTCTIFMALLMTIAPNAVVANNSHALGRQMHSTESFLADFSRDQAEKEVQAYLSKSDIQQELIKLGLEPSEVSARLANLSQQELQQLSGQIQEARAGGDVLLTVLVVILIVYLIQRI